MVPLCNHWESTSVIGCSVFVSNHDLLQLQLHSSRLLPPQEYKISSVSYPYCYHPWYFLRKTWQTVLTIASIDHNLVLFYLHPQCSDHETEGVWRNYYTGEEVDLSFAASGELNGGRAENCAILLALWNGWTDWKCPVPKVLNFEKTYFVNTSSKGTSYCVCL